MRRSAVLTWPSRVLLPLSALSLVGAVAYGRLSNDMFGVATMLGLVVTAGFAAVIVAGFRVNEVAPAVEVSAAPSYHEVPQVAAPGGGAWPFMAAVSITLALLGLVLGPVALYFAAGAGAITTVGWLGRVSSEGSGREMNLMPIGLPVLALLTVAAVMFFMSRILLAVPEMASTYIALAVAVLIMAVAIFFSVRPSLSPQVLSGTLALGAALMIGGGFVAAAAGEREIEPHGAGHGEVLELVAVDTAFDHTELEVAAGGEGAIEFTNEDSGVPHNVALFSGADAASAPIFRGDLLTGPGSTTYTFEVPTPGRYHFQCDVHPNTMTGTLVVTEAEADHGDEGVESDEGGEADHGDEEKAPAGAEPDASGSDEHGETP